MTSGMGIGPALAERLARGLGTLGLELPDTVQQALLDYLALMGKWTRVYNLTAVRDPEDMLTQHVLDSLSVLPALLAHTRGQPTRVLDVGSGGGLPGVVLAICRPELDVSCVDAVAKKAAFVQQVAATLKLPNLKGLHARVETLTEPYDVVCSRAFASLKDFTSWSRTGLASHGIWLAMKGKHPDAELAELPKDVQVFHVEPLKVPGLDAERCIVWMRG